MELDAVDRELAVANGHHLAVGGRRGDLERVRYAGGRERVVAAGLELVGKPAKEAASVVVHVARLAVDERAGQADLAAEGLDDRLVAEADAERGDAGREPLDDLERRA